MPQFTIPAGSLSRSVSSLGNALFGGGTGEIDGAIAAGRYNQSMAAARANDAQAGLYGQQSADIQQQMLVRQREMEALSNMQELMRQGVFGEMTPEAMPVISNQFPGEAAEFRMSDPDPVLIDNRGDLAAAALGMSGDREANLRAGITGALMRGDEPWSEQDLATLQVTSGAVDNYGQTLPGFAAGLANDTLRTQIQYGEPAPGGPISIDDANDLSAAMLTGVETTFGPTGENGISGEEYAAAEALAMDIYRETGDAAVARGEALRRLHAAEERQAASGGIFGMGQADSSAQFLDTDISAFRQGQIGQPGAEAGGMVGAFQQLQGRPPQEGDRMQAPTGESFVFANGQFIPEAAPADVAGSSNAGLADAMMSPVDGAPPGIGPTPTAYEMVDNTRRGSRADRQAVVEGQFGFEPGPGRPNPRRRSQ